MVDCPCPTCHAARELAINHAAPEHDRKACKICVQQEFYDLVQSFASNPRFKSLGSGSARRAFLDKKHPGFVIKVAQNPNAVVSNECEYDYYRTYGKFGGRLPVARCRLTKDHRILVMEYVKPNYPALFEYSKERNIPYCDGCQGGLDSKNRPVYYDYEIAPERKPVWRGGDWRISP